MTESPYNPLDMSNLAHSIVTAILEKEPTPLGEVPRFRGAGLYAIYYSGGFSAYEPLARENRDGELGAPIYVGKAVPAGGRRGVASTTSQRSSALASRIGQHASTIRAAANLDIADFWVRWLIVEDIWIPLGESALIRRYTPLWNVMVDGFGNHDPGAGRHRGMLSRWDTVHPGRSWTINFQPRTETNHQIEQEITEYLRSRLS